MATGVSRNRRAPRKESQVASLKSERRPAAQRDTRIAETVGEAARYDRGCGGDLDPRLPPSWPAMARRSS